MDGDQQPLPPPPIIWESQVADVKLLVHHAISQSEERFTSQEMSDDLDDVKSATDGDQQPLPLGAIGGGCETASPHKHKREIYYRIRQKMFSLLLAIYPHSPLSCLP